MADPTSTELLIQAGRGDRQAAEDLLPLIYEDLRALAASLLARERGDHTLQPTALVHEAFVRLVDGERIQLNDRAHFFRVAAQAMRRLLIDHARSKARQRHGGSWSRVTLSGLADSDAAAAIDVDIEALDRALTRLAEDDERQAQVVELRFFAGLSIAEIAQLLGISRRTVDIDWSMARAWLHRELSLEGA